MEATERGEHPVDQESRKKKTTAKSPRNGRKEQYMYNGRARVLREDCAGFRRGIEERRDSNQTDGAIYG